MSKLDILKPIQLVYLAFGTLLIIQMSIALENDEWLACGADVFIEDVIYLTLMASLIFGALTLFTRKVYGCIKFLIEVVAAYLGLWIASRLPLSGDVGRLFMIIIVGIVISLVTTGMASLAISYAEKYLKPKRGKKS